MQESYILTNYSLKSNNIKNINIEFSKPVFLNKFYINIDGLLHNAKQISFSKNRWKQNPQRFCLDHYNQPDYFKIVLMANKIPSVFAFDKENLKDGIIIAPLESTILKTIE